LEELHYHISMHKILSLKFLNLSNEMLFDEEFEKILIDFCHLLSDRPHMLCYVLLRLQEVDVGLSTGLIWVRIRKYVGLL